jgi:uncharacterized membrane protein (UPF0127 family)
MASPTRNIPLMDTSSLSDHDIVMRVIHQKSGNVLGKNIIAATSFWRRLRGYMFFEKPPQSFDGLYFPQCKLVHNSFVRFPIDVVFIDKAHAIVAIIRGFRPWSFSRIYFKAAHAIEFPAGTVNESVVPGDKLSLEFLGD